MNFLLNFTYADGTNNYVLAVDEVDVDNIVSNRRKQAGIVSYDVYRLVNSFTKEVTWTAKNS